MSYVTLQIETRDVLDELTTEELAAELQHRTDVGKVGQVVENDLWTILSLLKARNYDEAELLVERLCRPKFETLVDAMNAYRTAREARA